MKVIIIGGVAGGASAAARLRRINEHAEVIIFEKGEFVSFANCGLPYYIGNVIKQRSALLLQTPASFKSRFNIDVRVQQEVISINKEEKTVSVKNLITNEVYTENYDKLLLSPGADPIKPNLKGIESKKIFTLRNVPDTDRITSFIKTNNIKSAVVIGAGFIGLEMVENLHDLGVNVSLIEMANQVLAPVDYSSAAILQQHIRSKGVNLLLNTAVSGFEDTDSNIKVLLNNNTSIETDIVILSIGVSPDTKLAIQAGLKIGNTKGIWVDKYMQTSNEHIYAVGDAVEFIHPILNVPKITYLAGPANKQGRMVAHNITFGNSKSFNGSIGTAIVKVFDMTAACTGVSSKELTKFNIDHIVSITKSGSHAGYYPGAKQMTIQLQIEEKTGKLLGAQAVGFDGVDKRLDILSSMIQQGKTIEDLTEFEQSYAPPFSSAKDPVNMAGFVAENIITGKSKTCQWDDIAKINLSNSIIIDTRTITEFEKGFIPNAINIPVDDLRERLSEIPKDKNIYVYCQIGLRGYISQQILLQHGFNNVINLAGGYSHWVICDTENKLN